MFHCSGKEWLENTKIRIFKGFDLITVSGIAGYFFSCIHWRNMDDNLQDKKETVANEA